MNYCNSVALEWYLDCILMLRDINIGVVNCQSSCMCIYGEDFHSYIQFFVKCKLKNQMQCFKKKHGHVWMNCLTVSKQFFLFIKFTLNFQDFVAIFRTSCYSQGGHEDKVGHSIPESDFLCKPHYSQSLQNHRLI